MANEYAAAASYEGGAGGKIRRRLPRRTTPYDRPPTAPRNPSTDGRSSWLSKLVDPASRIISGSAARLFSSVFRKRLTGPPSASEMNSEPGHELPKDTCITPSAEQGQGSIKADDPSKIFDDHGINELGQLLKQKTFTRVEFDHLSELLRSRTVDLFAGNQNIITEPSTSQVATTYVSQENTTISPEDVEAEAGSPAELAKAYMGTGLSKASPPLCLQSGNAIGPSSLKSPNLPFATISSSRLSGLSENGHITQTLRSRSALYKMSHSPYSRGVEPADNGYAGPSTPSHWPRTNEMLSTGKQDVEEEAGSPVELAKAYMGTRSSKVSPPLRLRSQTSREDATLLNSVPSLLKSSNMPFATRSSGHLSGRSENGHLIQTPRGRSALYKMARSPYFRGVEPTDNGYAGPSTPSQLPRTNEMLSTGKRLLKRSSVLDDDFGSVGPIRRIRQKSSMMSPSKDRNVNSVPLVPLISDSTHVSKSSIQKLHPLVEPKCYDLNPQTAENGDVKISNASFPAVPPQSSEMARNILEQLDKLVPSPKEKSSELKLVMARENPPLKLTLENLNGRALMSMKAIESPKLQNGQNSGSLNGLSSTHLLKSGNLVAEKKDKVGDNGSMKKSDLRVMSSSEAGSVDNAIVSLEHISSVMKPVDSLVSGPTVALPQNKQAFKMSAPEDSLEMDDEDDVYISKNTVNPCSAEKEKPNPSFSECKTVSETVIIEKPPASPESKPATATNFTFNKRADLTARVSDGPNIAGKSVGFTFPTAAPSTPNPPQPSSTSQLPSFLNPPVLAEEQTGFPLFSFDSKSSDKGHTNFTFSSTVGKVSDAFSQNSGAGSDSKPDLLNSNAGTSMTSPVTPPEAIASNKDDKTLEMGNLYRSNDNTVSAGVSTSAIPNVFSLGASTNSSQSNGLLTSSAISVSSTSTNVASGSSTGLIFSSSPAATIGSNPSISATFPTSAPSIFKFGSGSSTDVASSNSVAAPPVSGLQLTGSEPKTKPPLLFNATGSSLSTAASISFTSTTSSVFGLNSSASTSTLNLSSAANHSQNCTPFVATSGSLFSTQVAPAVSSFPAFTQTMPSQFGSSASASLFGSGSSFGSAGSSSFVSTSSFGSTTDGAKQFGSGTAFGLSSSSSFSTGSSSFSSSSSSFASSGTTSLFGSSSQPAASSIFGSRFSSSSPSTTFSFGASTTAGSTPPAFGSSLGASSGSSMFSFTSAAAASSSSTLSVVQPVFGMPNPVGFGSASPGNDQMNVEDSMAEDTVQASTPTAAPAFGQLANTSSSSNFVFGSTAVPAGGSSVFQFGSHQSTSTPQSQSPFTAAGNLEFPSGGSFSLGTGGVDKSNRKYVRARRDKHRKK